jgi:hypothetical protein
MRVITLSHLPSKPLEYSPRAEPTLTEDSPELTAEHCKCIQGRGGGANRAMKELHNENLASYRREY